MQCHFKSNIKSKPLPAHLRSLHCLPLISKGQVNFVPIPECQYAKALDGAVHSTVKKCPASTACQPKQTHCQGLLLKERTVKGHVPLVAFSYCRISWAERQTIRYPALKSAPSIACWKPVPAREPRPRHGFLQVIHLANYVVTSGSTTGEEEPLQGPPPPSWRKT